MTSASGGTYAVQNPWDGWVDNLEPTLWIPTRYKLFSDLETQSEENHQLIPLQKKKLKRLNWK